MVFISSISIWAGPSIHNICNKIYIRQVNKARIFNISGFSSLTLCMLMDSSF